MTLVVAAVITADAEAMVGLRLLIALALGLTISAAGAGREVSAFELYDRIIDVLKLDYINPRGVNLDALSANYRPEVERACKGRSTCPYSAVEPIVERMILGIDDAHLDYSSPTVISRQARPGFVWNTAQLGFVPVANRTAVSVWLVQPGGVAEKAGIHTGDRITRVNVKDTEASVILRALLESERNTKPVKLEVVTPGREKRTVRLEPSTSSTQNRASAKPSLRMVGQTAVITVQTFVIENYNGDTLRAASQALHDLVLKAISNQATGIVLDLRNNGGGDQFPAYSLACAFVKRLKRVYTNKKGVSQVVSCEGAANTSVTYPQESDTVFEINVEHPSQWDGPLAVLTSRYTMSAAENLTDILQSQKRAIVVGAPTKGALGTSGDGVERFRNDAALNYGTQRITNDDLKPLPARVTPDILVPLDPDTIASGRDVQLERAIAAFR
jgi:carboxyl-terminal processing protease